MPLMRGAGGMGVRALVPGGGETVAQLTRAASGHLAIRVPDGALRGFAFGGVPQAPRMASPTGGFSASTGAAPAVSVPVSVVVNNTAGRGDERVDVRQRAEGGEQIVEVLIEAVRDRITQDFASGRGGLPGVVEAVYGLRRGGR